MTNSTLNMTMPPRQGMRSGWVLFWVSVWALIRRRRSVELAAGVEYKP